MWSQGERLVRTKGLRARKNVAVAVLGVHKSVASDAAAGHRDVNSLILRVNQHAAPGGFPQPGTKTPAAASALAAQNAG